MLLLLLLLLLERPTNLRIEIGIEEVIIRVQLTECMLREQTFGGRTIAGVAVSQFISLTLNTQHLTFTTYPQLEGKYSHSKAIQHETQSTRSNSLADLISDRWRLAIGDLVNSADSLLAGPGAAAGEHLQDNAAQTPDVYLGAVTFALGSDDFGRHPEDGPLHAVGLVVAVDVVCFLADAEVRDLARSIYVEEDVVGLQISVQNAFTV